MICRDGPFRRYSGVIVVGGIDLICDRDRGIRRAGWIFSSPRRSRLLKRRTLMLLHQWWNNSCGLRAALKLLSCTAVLAWSSSAWAGIIVSDTWTDGDR